MVRPRAVGMVGCTALFHAVFGYVLPIFHLYVIPVKTEKNIIQTELCVILFSMKIIKFANRNIFFDIQQ